MQDYSRSMQDASNNFKENPKKFWSFIKIRGQEASWVATLKNKNGYLKSNNTRRTEILNDQFQSVYSREDTASTPDKGPSPHQSMVNITINCNGITLVNVYVDLLVFTRIAGTS